MKNTLGVVGITVCVGYSELLELALRSNTTILRHIYVITKIDDIKTIKICEEYDNVETIYYDFLVDRNFMNVHLKRYNDGHMPNKPDMREEFIQHRIDAANDGGFNKGGGLRLGQQVAAKNNPDCHQLIMDSDIVLSDEMRPALNIDLVPGMLYVPTERRDYHKMKDYINKSNYQTMYHSGEGWGFFQLYTPVSEASRVFYDDWPAANKTDVWFRDDVIKGDHNNIKRLDSHVDHLGAVGDSIHYKKFNFDFKT